MYVDLESDLEKRFKITIAQRSRRLTIKTAISEAIELWIKKQKETKTEKQ